MQYSRYTAVRLIPLQQLTGKFRSMIKTITRSRNRKFNHTQAYNGSRLFRLGYGSKRTAHVRVATAYDLLAHKMLGGIFIKTLLNFHSVIIGCQGDADYVQADKHDTSSYTSCITL